MAKRKKSILVLCKIVLKLNGIPKRRVSPIENMKIITPFRKIIGLSKNKIDKQVG